MPKSQTESAGLLLFRRVGDGFEVLLAHPGGPFWRNKDAGAWTIPKGGFEGDENPALAAIREFEEEIGPVPGKSLIPLGTIRQKAGKLVHAFACEGDFDPAEIQSNTFETEWPPGSGRQQTFPEVDRCAWYDPATAREKINPAQAELIDRLAKVLEGAE